MAAQGERVPGVVVMCSCLDPMAQDKSPEQEHFFPPQMDSEPEMGVAAAYDTSPPRLRQNPPILAESAQPSTLDIGRLLAALAGMENNMNEKMQGLNKEMSGMNNKMEANTRKMDGMAQTMREEMQCMGEGVKKAQEQLKGEMEKGKKAVKEF